LTIVTRACRRPVMLGVNIDSVLAQTDRDIEQVFIVDNDRRGVARANAQLDLNRERADGSYVYILDDDTRLINREFVAHLRKVVVDRPHVVMVRSRRPQMSRDELPTAWGRRDWLKKKTTNCLCYVVRGDWYREHIVGFNEKVCGDWHFLNRLLEHDARLVWLDHFVGETQQLGRGKKFEKCKPDWFRQVARKYGIQEVAPGDWRLRLWQPS
jgi:hypothetical protein